ncbi:MAG: helix-turn-helix transcriptional regulator [Chitinophagales bacterium]
MALFRARKSLGLSQQAVAAAVGISRSFYTLIERGIRNPSLSVALSLSKLFAVSPEELFAPDEERTGEGRRRWSRIDRV